MCFSDLPVIPLDIQLHDLLEKGDALTNVCTQFGYAAHLRARALSNVQIRAAELIARREDTLVLN
jgi:hypothetical protein